MKDQKYVCLEKLMIMIHHGKKMENVKRTRATIVSFFLRNSFLFLSDDKTYQ